MLSNVFKAFQYSRLVSSMLALPKDVKKDLGLNSDYDVIKRAREMIYA